MTNTVAKRQNGNPSTIFGNVVDNIFQNSLRRFFDENYWDTDVAMNTGKVPVNIRETESAFELDLIAPGCKKEDFKIKIEDNALTISFEQKTGNTERDEKAGWVRNEFTQRSFSRSFTLDDTVDANKINASYVDGVLKVTLAKNEKAKRITRNIEVK